MLFERPLRGDENLQARVELLESCAPEAPFKLLVGNRREPLQFLVCPALRTYHPDKLRKVCLVGQRLFREPRNAATQGFDEVAWYNIVLGTRARYTTAQQRALLRFEAPGWFATRGNFHFFGHCRPFRAKHSWSRGRYEACQGVRG